jgi:hypothetical protein
MNETIPRWESKRTDETRTVEDVVRKTFPNADAYRYNSATIRLRVIDERFTGLSDSKRDELIEPLIEQLPEDTQRDIITLMAFTPSEVDESTRVQLTNLEFEDPSPSEL